MNPEQRLATGIHLIAGPDISDSADATAFIIDCGEELVMIDSGAGFSARTILINIEALGFDPNTISTLILTHNHIDHIGGAPFFKERFHCALVAHELDAAPIEHGDVVATAANAYGTIFPPTALDRKLSGNHGTITCGHKKIHWLHIPGHTPGSIAPYIDRDGQRIVFGQDIHGPFLKQFESNIEEWKVSMEKLLNLNADILCEGHFGIFRGQEAVKEYIQGYLRQFSVMGSSR